MIKFIFGEENSVRSVRGDYRLVLGPIDSLWVL